MVPALCGTERGASIGIRKSCGRRCLSLRRKHHAKIDGGRRSPASLARNDSKRVSERELAASASVTKGQARFESRMAQELRESVGCVRVRKKCQNFLIFWIDVGRWCNIEDVRREGESKEVAKTRVTNLTLPSDPGPGCPPPTRV